MSARIFLGEPACRDPKWLRVSIDFTIDAFATAFVLRMFPTRMRFIVARFLPSRYRLRRHRQKAAKVIAAKIENRLDALRRKQRGEVVEEETTLLDWMMDHGTKEENELSEMANRHCVMTLASIYTRSTNTATFLFEFCAHPEWFYVLRKEIEDVEKQTGDEPEVDIRWHSRLEQMDSLLLECFRVHRPILCE